MTNLKEGASLFSKEKVLICFTGVDGSGKTTHARHLLRFLLKKGYSSKYVWAASRPIFLYPFLVVTRILEYWKTVKKDAWTDPLENAPPSIRKKIGALYRFLLFVDFEIITLLKVQLPLLFVKVVICDRYVYDLIMELALSNLHSTSFAKLMLHATPAPKRTFFTDTPIHVVVQRRPNFTQKNIRAKQNIYRKLAKIFKFKIIDTSAQFEANQESIRKEVLSLLEETDRNS